MKSSLRVMLLTATFVAAHSVNGAQIQYNGPAPQITGPRRENHMISLVWNGPLTGETNSTNPFRDYRMRVRITDPNAINTWHEGHYAANGNAGQTGVENGKKWRVYFTPTQPGTYLYFLQFLSGPDAAISDPPAGTQVPLLHGASGSFTVDPLLPSDPPGRQKGLLVYTGEHYRRYMTTGEVFFKTGAGSPENWLAGSCIDGTSDAGGQSPNTFVDFAAHADAPDWMPGDREWTNHNNNCYNAALAGRGQIGAINYLASHGMNSIYVLTLNHTGMLDQGITVGDGSDVWPWRDYTVRDRFDVSKLDQWGMIFEQASDKGIHLQLMLQELEIDESWENGDLGIEHKLYLRELVSRFGANLAITWDLGEENGQTEAQRKAMASYIRSIDPYHHAIKMHSLGDTNPADSFDPYHDAYDGLLGYGDFEGIDGQIYINSGGFFENVWPRVIEWRGLSAANNRKWEITIDELSPGLNVEGIAPQFNIDRQRKIGLWNTLLAGGAGLSLYFPTSFDGCSPLDGCNGSCDPVGTCDGRCTDLDCDGYGSRSAFYPFLGVIHEFLAAANLPFDDMVPLGDSPLLSNVVEDGEFRALLSVWDDPLDLNDIALIYLPLGGTGNIDLTSATGTFNVFWFDPVAGGGLITGNPSTVSGGAIRALGTPTTPIPNDAVVLLRR